jgi:hypothetical protein
LEVRRQRVRTMAECDALLLVGNTDGRAVDHDMLVVGRTDRNSARAISRRLLPCAVLDTGDVATSRRLTTAHALGVSWINAAHGEWIPRVQDWLRTTARTADPV